MDWCSVYVTPQGLPKYIYLSPPLIFPTTYNGIRTKNRPVWITPGAAPIRWTGSIRNPHWEQKNGMRVTLSYLPGPTFIPFHGKVCIRIWAITCSWIHTIITDIHDHLWFCKIISFIIIIIFYIEFLELVFSTFLFSYRWRFIYIRNAINAY